MATYAAQYACSMEEYFTPDTTYDDAIEVESIVTEDIDPCFFCGKDVETDGGYCRNCGCSFVGCDATGDVYATRDSNEMMCYTHAVQLLYALRAALKEVKAEYKVEITKDIQWLMQQLDEIDGGEE